MLIGQLERLSRGLHPDNGFPMPDSSITHTPEIQATLASLVVELRSTGYIPSTARKSKYLPTDQAKSLMAKNEKEGKPKRSGFPWSGAEYNKIRIAYVDKQKSIEAIAKECLRSELSVAAKLESLGLMTFDEYEAFKKAHGVSD